MPEGAELQEILWQIYSRYTEIEIDAMTDRDLETLNRLAVRKELIKKAVSVDPREAINVIWERVSEIAGEIQSLVIEHSGKKFSAFLVELQHYSEILSQIEDPPAPDEVDEYLKRKLGSDAPGQQKPSEISTPDEPKEQRTSSSLVQKRTYQRHTTGQLSDSDLKALKLMAWGNHSTFNEVAKEVWPNENPDNRSTLSARLIWTRTRIIRFLEYVWEQPERISGEEQKVLDELKKSFGDLESVRSRINRWSKGGSKISRTKSNKSPAQQTPRPQLMPQANSSTEALTGFMSEEHTKVIRASILHSEWPTLSVPELVKRTGFTHGALPSLIAGAMNGLQGVLDAFDSNRPLADDAQTIAREIRALYPTQTAQQIRTEVIKKYHSS